MRRLHVSLSAALIFAAASAVLIYAGLLTGRLPLKTLVAPDADYLPPELRIESARFSQIDGWAAADHLGALSVFARSCERIAALPDVAPANPVEALGPFFRDVSLAGTAADWKPACAGAATAATSADAARRFFETRFTPVRILNLRVPRPEARIARKAQLSAEGLFTGYFEPSYAASRTRDAQFTAPLLARPPDLVMADLGEFRDALAGERVAGFVAEGRLRPYPDHAAINAGVLSDRTEVLAWLDPNDLFFLQIQGSGRLRFPDGAVMRVGYDGQNGRPYTAVGRALIEMGAVPREKISMQTIRAWLDAAPPPQARTLRELNQSYVFFRELEAGDPAQGPIGAEGLPLSPGKSLAVDRRFHAMGTPVLLAFRGEHAALSGLYVAQDTGGAIRGPVRGDIFVGAGPDAGEIAGELKAEGEMIVLLPRPAAAKLAPPR